MTRSIQIDVALAGMRAEHDRQSGAHAVIQRQHDAAVAERKKALGDIETWELVQQLLSMTSEASREQIRAHIEATVTAALKTVFGEGLSFRVVIGQMGGQPTVDWNVESLYGDNVISTGVEDARGGGVVDVISLALRLAVLEIYQPKIGGPLVLDEPGRHVSAEYAVNLARFLQAYSKQTGRQCVMVTHQTALAEYADRSFRVVLRSGVSEVTQA